MNIGIILLGGKGLRLTPQSIFVNKHLNIIYDKPVFFYSLTALILSGIDSLVMSCNKEDQTIFRKYSYYLSKIGLPTSVVTQPTSGGIPTAIQVCKNKIKKNSTVSVILGDNLLVGNDLIYHLNQNNEFKKNHAICFLKKVADLKKFGVARVDKNNKICDFLEKPTFVKSSDRAVIGFYQFPYSVFKVIANLKPSKRGETEIIDILKYYKKKNCLKISEFGRGVYWSDIGSHDSILDSNNFIKSLQNNSGQIIGLPEEALLYVKKMKKKHKNYIKNFYKENKDYTKYLTDIILKARW
jgi:glucose-1-phosphate thymidylyltransferase